jgi:hypothetical protein
MKVILSVPDEDYSSHVLILSVPDEGYLTKIGQGHLWLREENVHHRFLVGFVLLGL